MWEFRDFPALSLRFCLLFILFYSAATVEAQSPGDLLVMPTRLVFEGRTRSAEISLVNKGATSATYRISFIQIRMNAEGGTREINLSEALPDERFADQIVRYSPRQVVLEPRGAQTIRLQLRKGENLPPGEYRSHLLFRAVPTELDRELDLAPIQLGVHLRAIFGVSIPVIVRHGELSAGVRLSSPHLRETEQNPATTPPPPTLRVKLERSGNASIYGDLQVFFEPLRGKSQQLGQTRGVAVYFPNSERWVTLPLQQMPQGAGRLRIVFHRSESPHDLLAETELLLP